MEMFDVVSFECKDTNEIADATLAGVDAEIASMTVDTDKGTYSAALETAGEINIEFDGQFYRDPQDFPEELVELIRDSRGACLFDGSVDGLMCWANNWFQVVVFDADWNMLSSDPEIIEDDICDLGEEGVHDLLAVSLENYLDSYC